MWLTLKGFFLETPVTALALIFGILGVVLTIRQSIFCWPAALISVLAATIDFYRSSLYGDMALQIFYFFAGLYGWIYWNQRKNEVFEIKRLDPRRVPALALATALQFLLYYFLLVYFNGARPFLDALLTAASLTTTYMMTKKWVENWLLWVVIDSTYILLYGLTDLWAYAFLYLFFCSNSFLWLDQMEKSGIIKIAVLGAESTGKTSLCEQLAAAYNTVFVPEYAREYFNDSDIYNYTLEDLVIIAKKQLELEDEYLKKANRFLFCDTTLITLKIWAELEFEQVPEFIATQLQNVKYDHYFLTDNSLPWVEDPLRQNKHSRDMLFEMNLTEIKQLGEVYTIITGNDELRLKNAMNILDKRLL